MNRRTHDGSQQYLWRDQRRQFAGVQAYYRVDVHEQVCNQQTQQCVQVDAQGFAQQYAAPPVDPGSPMDTIEGPDWDGEIRPAFVTVDGRDALTNKQVAAPGFGPLQPPTQQSLFGDSRWWVAFDQVKISGADGATAQPSISQSEAAPRFDESQDHYVRRTLRHDVHGYTGAPTMLHSGHNIQLGLAALRTNEHLGLEQHHEGTQVAYELDGTVHFSDGYGGVKTVHQGSAAAIPRNVPHDLLNVSQSTALFFSFYSPKVHPEATGVYAEKFPIGVRGPEEDSIRPYNGNEVVSVDPVALHARHLTHRTSDTLLKTQDMEVRVETVAAGRDRLFNKEGYYYVVSGRCQLHIDSVHHGRDGFSGGLADDIAAGSMFYLAPNDICTVSVRDTTSSANMLVFAPRTNVHTDHAHYGDLQEYPHMIVSHNDVVAINSGLAATQTRVAPDESVPESDVEVVGESWSRFTNELYSDGYSGEPPQLLPPRDQ